MYILFHPYRASQKWEDLPVLIKNVGRFAV